jgi:hypothetical protein
MGIIPKMVDEWLMNGQKWIPKPQNLIWLVDDGLPNI